MVFLKEVLIYNFKSFHGKVVVGPFMPFTAIIGPNGSGKSNVMDAISFAMGEKSSTLRVHKLSDLISRGTDGKPVASSAYVTAIFLTEDKDRSFTRKINGSTSEYKVENQKVTNELYLTELAQLGINIKDQNCLVFQGAIEAILLKSPRELTTLFEKISNSAALVSEYERLETEMNEADLNFKFAHTKKMNLLLKKRNDLIEKEETEEYQKLQTEYLKRNTELQLLYLYKIKQEVDILYTAKNKKKVEINTFANKKNIAEELLKQKKLYFNTLVRDQEEIEQNILKAENEFAKEKLQFVADKEQISYLRNRVKFASTSYTEACSANEVHRNIIIELNEELTSLQQIKANFESDFDSQGSNITLDDEQVQHYWKLKTVARQQSDIHVIGLNSLTRKQETDKDALDNENRKRNEIRQELDKNKYIKEDLKKRIKKLEEYILVNETNLMNQNENKNTLWSEIGDSRSKVDIIENKIKEITETLSDAKLDEYTISREKEKIIILNTLKQLFSGVHGYLSALCKPIHPRYNIAITKVLGKYSDAIIVNTVEIAKSCIQYLKEQRIGVFLFLPLNNLKVEHLKERLRDIQEPKNVKLLYDLLIISEKKIENAILFVTKNILVCETAEDAQLLAYGGRLNNRYDCITLDGSFYSKYGIISGGRSELSKKSKIWDKQKIDDLKLQKATLKAELKKAIENSEKQSEINIIDTYIHGIFNRIKYAKTDLENTKKELANIDKQLEINEREILSISDKIKLLEETIRNRYDIIHTHEKHVHKVENTVFKHFCENLGIDNIRSYEKQGLRIQQERTRRKLEIDEQYERISNMLNYENSRNLEREIVKWKSTLEKTTKQLEDVLQKDRQNKLIGEEKEKIIKELQAKYQLQTAEVNIIEKEIGTRRREVGVISKLLIEFQRELTSLNIQIKREEIEWRKIIEDCQIEGIIIPTTSQSVVSDREEHNMSNTSDTNISTPNAFFQVDFSHLPNNLCNINIEDLNNVITQISKEVADVKHKLELFPAPNLKIGETINLTLVKLNEAKADEKKAFEYSKNIRNQFSKIKQKRSKIFMECFEQVVAHVNVIYKQLVNDTSAQATLVPSNPEEPYLDNISYSCIAPGKRFLPIHSFSGGEKTLAALSLLFAMHSYKSCSLVILDEVDAALDNDNIQNFIRFIKAQRDSMQCIIISLKKEIFSHADLLVGISVDPDTEFINSNIYTLPLNQYHDHRNK